MADLKRKLSLNISGNFFVDDQCIACNACIVEAPECFKMNEDEGLAYVFKQPENESEELKCQSAIDCCPVDSIGSIK